MASVSGAPDAAQPTDRVLLALRAALRASNDVPAHLVEGILLMVRVLTTASDELAALDALGVPMRQRRDIAHRCGVAEKAIDAYRIAIASMGVTVDLDVPPTDGPFGGLGRGFGVAS